MGASTVLDFSKASSQHRLSIAEAIGLQLNQTQTACTATGEARCGAHVFEGFCGLEHEPVKCQNEGRNKVGLLWMPLHPQKTIKPDTQRQTRGF